MHIAHFVNQLYELSSLMHPLPNAKTTIKCLWKHLVGCMMETLIEADALAGSLRFQVRYE